MRFLRGWSLSLRFADSWIASLDQRVQAENTLLASAAGKSPILTREECRALACKLRVRS